MTAPQPLPEGWGHQLYPVPDAPKLGLVHGARPLDGVKIPEGRPYIGLNMVSSIDGRSTIGESPKGLGSPTDRNLMQRLRAEADALLHGASTVRMDRFAPKVDAYQVEERRRAGFADNPAGIVVTGSGEGLESSFYFRDATEEWPRYVFAGSESARKLERPGVSVVVDTAGGRGVNVPSMMKHLHDFGLRVVMCEGGPTLNAELFAAHAVDELFITVGSLLVGGTNPLTMIHGDLPETVQARLVSIYEREGELFLRYAFDYTSQ